MFIHEQEICQLLGVSALANVVEFCVLSDHIQAGAQIGEMTQAVPDRLRVVEGQGHLY